jgi:hypothetical protein
LTRKGSSLETAKDLCGRVTGFGQAPAQTW